MKIFGQIKDGVVVIDPPNGLPEGTVVEILPVDSPGDDPGRPIDPSFPMGDLAVDLGDPDLSNNLNSDAVARRMDAGTVSGGIPDLASNIDHYLYGHPKAHEAPEAVPPDNKCQSPDASLPIGDVTGGQDQLRPGPKAEASEPPFDKSSLLYRMLDLAGPAGIPDLSMNIDHYLYGHPKADDQQ